MGSHAAVSHSGFNASSPPLAADAKLASAGFSLIEVLVALVILSIAFGASVRAVSQSTVTLEALRDRTEANAILSERLDELRTAGQWPPLGEKSQSFFSNKRKWYWKRTTTDTADSDVRKVEMQVGLDKTETTKAELLVTRIAYIRRENIVASKKK